jgi:hypothetical protein
MVRHTSTDCAHRRARAVVNTVLTDAVRRALDVIDAPAARARHRTVLRSYIGMAAPVRAALVVEEA